MSEPCIKTVGELIAYLQHYDPSLPVKAIWDSCDWPVYGVTLDKGEVLIFAEYGHEHEYPRPKDAA